MRIGLVSPTRAHKLLTCPQRLAFEQLHAGGVQRSSGSPASQLGITVHRTLELALRDRGLSTDDAWCMACDEASLNGADPRELPEGRRTRLRIERRLPALLDLIAQRQPTDDGLLYEHELASPDGRVAGQLDLLVLAQQPLVVDYKTGVALEEGEPLGHFWRQLAVYAWLVDKALGIDVAESVLFSLRDGIVRVDTSSSVREEAVAEILAAQDAYNERVPGPQTARPSEDGCTFCPFVGECDEAWAALQSGFLARLGTGVAVIGEVDGEVVAASNALSGVPIRVLSNSGWRSGIISDVPQIVSSHLQVGTRFRCWALGLRSEEPLSLSWRGGASHLVKLL